MTHHRFARLAAIALIAAAVPFDTDAAAQSTWAEVRSGHFTVWSNADNGSTRTLAWQFEQIRSALKVLWPFTRVDLSKPLLVLAVRDETSMRALAPRYWETRGMVHPASVWVTGPDRNYLVIRADLRGEDRETANPHQAAYYSYVSLVLDESFGRPLPVWFSRGMSGLLSNTVVRDSYIKMGQPIVDHLETLRSHARLRLSRLVAMPADAPELKRDLRLSDYDAQAWAFVHFLMFAEKGVYRPKLNQFINLIRADKDPAAALAESLGNVDDYETAFSLYLTQGVYPYGQADLDNQVKREGFAIRQLPPAESLAGRAALHAAMQRPNEANALLLEARRVDAGAPDSYLAEALLLDGSGSSDGAQAAYLKAVELGTTSAYAHYRLAILTGGAERDTATLTRIEKLLLRAVALDTRFANAYSYLAETRSMLGMNEEATAPLALRGVALEPGSSYHRLALARVYWRLNKLDEAQREAQLALTLARSDGDKARVQEAINGIERARVQPRLP